MRVAIQKGPLVAAALAAVAAASPAHAQTRSWYEAGDSDRIGLRLGPDVAVAGLGLAGFVVPELLKQRLAPAACNACNGADNSGVPGDPRDGRGDLNGVDAFFHDALTGAALGRKTADTLSNVWAFAALPAGALGAAFLTTGPHATDGAGARAAFLVVESTAVSAALIQSVKFFVARKRPFVRYGHGTNGSQPATGTTYDVSDRDSHVSFPSGHTALATALGVSLAMTATLEESRAAPYLWGAAAVMSVSTASLRMIAEKHYLTDVAVGALVGAGCGVAVPWLHKRSNVPGPGGSVTLSSRSNGSPLLMFSGTM